MNNLTGYIRDELRCHGAALVGFADLTGLPPETRDNMPVGVSIAVAYPKDVIRGIADMPTRAFYDQYGIINRKLQMLIQLGAEALRLEGYEAIPLTESYVDETATDYSTRLPHKTVATRAGLGWIGKSALLDAPACRNTARSRAKASFGIEITQCGKCMYICPHTQRFLNGGD